MLPWNSDNTHRTIHSILELYQRCRRKGDWAKVYLETQDGRECFSISVSPSAGTTAGGAGVEKMERAKRKNPSQVRRDRQRRAAFLERRHQGVAATPATLTATNIAGTDKEEMDEEKTEIESGAGETSSAKVEASEANEEDINNEINTGENRLTQENIEELRRLIKEDINNGLYKKDLETWKMEKPNNKNEDSKDKENDNIEDAKVWALKQKQSFKNIEIESFSSLEH